jgi:hypothetical protein
MSHSADWPQLATMSPAGDRPGPRQWEHPHDLAEVRGPNMWFRLKVA